MSSGSVRRVALQFKDTNFEFLHTPAGIGEPIAPDTIFAKIFGVGTETSKVSPFAGF
jgi:hypothetical protein